GVEQLAQRGVPAEQRLHRQVVARVVAVVRGGGDDWIRVDGGRAEIRQVIEAIRDTAQITALAAVQLGRRVPVLERAGRRHPAAPGEPVGEDLVEDGVGDPGRRVAEGRIGHPLTPPKVTPLMSHLLLYRKSATTGMETSTDDAARSPHWVWNCAW